DQSGERWQIPMTPGKRSRGAEQHLIDAVVFRKRCRVLEQPIGRQPTRALEIPGVRRREGGREREDHAGERHGSDSGERWNREAGTDTPSSRSSSTIRGTTPVAVKYPVIRRPSRPRRRKA